MGMILIYADYSVSVAIMLMVPRFAYATRYPWDQKLMAFPESRGPVTGDLRGLCLALARKIGIAYVNFDRVHTTRLYRDKDLTMVIPHGETFSLIDAGGSGVSHWLGSYDRTRPILLKRAHLKCQRVIHTAFNFSGDTATGSTYSYLTERGEVWCDGGDGPEKVSGISGAISLTVVRHHQLVVGIRSGKCMRISYRAGDPEAATQDPPSPLALYRVVPDYYRGTVLSIDERAMVRRTDPGGISEIGGPVVSMAARHENLQRGAIYLIDVLGRITTVPQSSMKLVIPRASGQIIDLAFAANIELYVVAVVV